jgi:hypothetical protein
MHLLPMGKGRPSDCRADARMEPNYVDTRGGISMIRRAIVAVLCAMALSACLSAKQADAQERAYGRVWGNAYGTQDWDRFYHYPYVFYPQNYWGNEYYRTRESLYFRYPPEMRIPVYNKKWHNYYPEGRRYHYGHHFILDVF